MDPSERRAGRPGARAAAQAGSRTGRRSSNRARQPERFGRFLGFTALGSLIPGTGLLAAGRRGWGKFVLALVLLGVLGIGFVLWQVPRDRLAFGALNREVLTVVAVGLVVLAIGWLIVALASHRALEPDGLSGGKRLAGSLVVIVTAGLVLSPVVIAAKYALTASDLFGALSRASSTAPDDVDKHNPWEDLPHVNVLLMGSDAGIGREGVRPDTLILASIDTDTGDTVMFSLPRNLEKVPFPADSELAQHYPNGFTDGVAQNDAYFINAVYNHLPGFLPEGVADQVFAGSDDPGADATKLAVSGALGLDVHYYVMADLQGFQDIVNAMGGITIDVPYPVPLGVKADNGSCTFAAGRDPATAWILPGDGVELTGGEALWFARARCAPQHPDPAYQDSTGQNSPLSAGDYNRMARQRCVIGAIADRAEPLNLLTNFESLAAAAEQNVATDIPPDLWSAFAELGVKVKGASMLSLPLTKAVIEQGTRDYSTPNYAFIHGLVQETLSSEPDASSSAEATAEAGSGNEADEPGNDQNGSESNANDGVTDDVDADGAVESSDGLATEPSDRAEPDDVSVACG